jgi:hypothetical protein
MAVGQFLAFGRDGDDNRAGRLALGETLGNLEVVPVLHNQPVLKSEDIEDDLWTGSRDLGVSATT